MQPKAKTPRHANNGPVAWPDDEIKPMFKGVVVALGWHKLTQKDPGELAGQIFTAIKRSRETNYEVDREILSRDTVVLHEVVWVLGLENNVTHPYLRVDTNKLRKDLQLFLNVYDSVILSDTLS